MLSGGFGSCEKAIKDHHASKFCKDFTLQSFIHNGTLPHFGLDEQ